MTTKIKQVAILAPDYLLTEFSSTLSQAPGAREALATGVLVLSADAEAARADSIIVIAPRLERVLDWARSTNSGHPPLAAASRLLARFAHTASGRNSIVIDEHDLHRRPTRVLRTIGETIGLPPEILAEAECIDPAGQFEGRNSGPEIEPIQIYASLPVLPGATAWWPREIFCTYEGPCPSSIDITGRSRILCFGPYIALPRGPWNAELIFDVCDAAAQYDYLLEFGTTGNFSRELFRPSQSGRQHVRLNYLALENEWAEIRIGVTRAAFHGELNLIGAHITRASPE